MTSTFNPLIMMMASPLFLASTLAFLSLLPTSAPARTLPDCSLLKATIIAVYGRNHSPPPPPISSPSTHQLTNNYGRPLHYPPPPPNPSSPKGQLEDTASPCPKGQSPPCNSYISMVTVRDYGRPLRSPPPPPYPASPSRPLHKSLQESPPSHLLASA